MATVVSLINMKGGVGKTTLAMQLALAAAQKGLKVLAVDLDPQSNLSHTLMRAGPYVQHLREFRPTIVDLFERYRPPTSTSPSPTPLGIEDVILKKCGHAWGRDTLDLIPSRLELAHTLKNPTGKERRLAKALSRVAADYDVVLIDCAPTESILTEAAYLASRFLLVPIKPEFMAAIGLPLLARSLKEFQAENGDHALDICGIVFNHSSSYSVGPEGHQSVEEVSKIAMQHKWPVFSTHIKYSGSYAKAAREGSSISATSHVRWPTSRNFDAFYNEFISAIGVAQVSA
jgi:chromosome partitioning protein